MRSAHTLAALVLVQCGLVQCGDPSFRFDVTLPETGGLKPGDNVMLRGLAIGQIRDVDIEADGVVLSVEIKPRFRSHLRTDCAFRVAPERLVTGKMMLAVDPGSDGEFVAAGARVAGHAPPTGPAAALTRALDDSVDYARDQAKGLAHAVIAPDDLPPRATDGTIDLDRPGGFVIRIESVRVARQTADGDEWDSAGGGPPDLVAQVWVGARQVLLTPVAEDTHAAQWDTVSEPFDLASDSVVRVKVLDRDLGFNDEIGIASFAPTALDAAAGRQFRLAAGRVEELKLRVEPATTPPPARHPPG